MKQIYRNIWLTCPVVFKGRKRSQLLGGKPLFLSRLGLHLDFSKSFCLNPAYLHSLLTFLPPSSKPWACTTLHLYSDFSWFNEWHIKVLWSWETKTLLNVLFWDKNVATSRWWSVKGQVGSMNGLPGIRRPASTRPESLSARKVAGDTSSWKQGRTQRKDKGSFGRKTHE